MTAFLKIHVEEAATRAVAAPLVTKNTDKRVPFSKCSLMLYNLLLGSGCKKKRFEKVKICHIRKKYNEGHIIMYISIY